MRTPHRLRCWKPRDRLVPGQLFTCARPGRCEMGTKRHVPDHLVHKWVAGLPGRNGTVIVSLLGRKPPKDEKSKGRSEYGFYSFHGDVDASERLGTPHFSEWLTRYHRDRDLELGEYPTTDIVDMPDDQLCEISACVEESLKQGRTVVLVDSGGWTRTGCVCRHMGFVEDPTWRPNPS